MCAAKTISLDQFREKKKQQQEEQTIYGKLVWLHCPQCKTLEYSEILAPAGRRHKCGSQVLESEVEVDLRAEVTVTLHNLGIIDQMLEENKKSKLKFLAARNLVKALEQLKLSENHYLERLNLVAGSSVEPYPGSMQDLLEKLPPLEKNPLGLFLTPFRCNPEQRFSKK